MKFDLKFVQTLIKNHKKAARGCWPEGEYVYFVEGRVIPVDSWWSQFPCQAPTASDKELGSIKISDHIDKVWGKGFREIGWKPNKDDDEADDWYFLD